MSLDVSLYYLFSVRTTNVMRRYSNKYTSWGSWAHYKVIKSLLLPLLRILGNREKFLIWPRPPLLLQNLEYLKVVLCVAKLVIKSHFFPNLYHLRLYSKTPTPKKRLALATSFSLELFFKMRKYTELTPRRSLIFIKGKALQLFYQVLCGYASCWVLESNFVSCLVTIAELELFRCTTRKHIHYAGIF